MKFGPKHLLSFGKAFTIAHCALVLFGAPFFEEILLTTLLSLLISCLIFWPVVVAFDVADLQEIAVILLNRDWLTKPQEKAIYTAYGTVIGAWIGVFPIPLDWDVWYQVTLSDSYHDGGVDRICELTNLVRNQSANPQTFKALLRMNAMHSSSSSSKLHPNEYIIPQVPKIKAMFFCEFDLDKGPVIRVNVEDGDFNLDDVLDSRRFASYSSALIPRDELLNKHVKIGIHTTRMKYKVMGYPVGLQKPEWFSHVPKRTAETYRREKYRFCVCIIVPHEASLDENDYVYELFVEKMTSYLLNAEIEEYFLSDRKDNNVIHDYLRVTLESINSTGEAQFQLTKKNRCYLKILPPYRGREPPDVLPHMVPIIKKDLKLTPDRMCKMDVVSYMLVPKINGIRCVKELAMCTGLDTELVTRCIKALCYFDILALAPLFLYSNNYVATEKLHDFYNDANMIQECLEFVRRRVKRKKTNEIIILQPPKFTDVFRLYLNLKIGQRLSEFVITNDPKSLFVDVRRFIQFGMIRGFLRKLSIYPIVINFCTKGSLLSKFDGTRPLEDLAVEFAIEPMELYNKLKASGKLTFITK
ncbi:unnamed protein product, partial [Mesorhabditis belari]|uniref:Nitrogen permease regulator 2-like protein n=1 Tax=Mesorhabditis belari TaxID=2138241 RepID=A0AAF3EPU4_9BILA